MLPYKLYGTVEHGQKLGTKMKMPTANIFPENAIDGLAYGVYYSRLYVDGICYKAITNLGLRPTVSDEPRVNAESFIYDFSGDLYNRKIEVELLEFKRPEMKFASIAELEAQMHSDIEAGKKY